LLKAITRTAYALPSGWSTGRIRQKQLVPICLSRLTLYEPWFLLYIGSIAIQPAERRREYGGNSVSELFEAMMVICFGISWPLSILKSWKSRTTKGKSLLFLFFIFFGYACGILSKLVGHNITYVFIFYVLNFVMVGTDIFLYFRNKRLEMAGTSSLPA
jgi:hypothetical protein